MKLLNGQQLRRYRRHGFVYPVQAFSPADRRGLSTGGGAHTRQGVTAVPGAPSYRVKPYLLCEWAARLVRDQLVPDAVEGLIGPDIRSHLRASGQQHQVLEGEMAGDCHRRGRGLR